MSPVIMKKYGAREVKAMPHRDARRRRGANSRMPLSPIFFSMLLPFKPETALITAVAARTIPIENSFQPLLFQ